MKDIRVCVTGTDVRYHVGPATYQFRDANWVEVTSPPVRQAEICRCGDGVDVDSRGYCLSCCLAVRGKGPALTAENKLTTDTTPIALRSGPGSWDTRCYWESVARKYGLPPPERSRQDEAAFEEIWDTCRPYDQEPAFAEFVDANWAEIVKRAETDVDQPRISRVARIMWSQYEFVNERIRCKLKAARMKSRRWV